jgi:hypothetical protein
MDGGALLGTDQGSHQLAEYAEREREWYAVQVCCSAVGVSHSIASEVSGTISKSILSGCGFCLFVPNSTTNN